MHTFHLELQGETIVFLDDPDPRAPSCAFEVHVAPGADDPHRTTTWARASLSRWSVGSSMPRSTAPRIA